MWNKIKNWIFVIGSVAIGIFAFILGRKGNNRDHDRTVAELEDRITKLKSILQRERELTERERKRISTEAERIRKEGERLKRERELSDSAGASLERIDRIIREVERANKETGT